MADEKLVSGTVVDVELISKDPEATKKFYHRVFGWKFEGRIRHDFLFPGIVAGVTAFVVSRFWGVPYPEYHVAFEPTFTELLFLKTVAIGVLCGVAASWFVELLHLARRAFDRLRQHLALWPPLVPTIGGAT